MGTNLIIPTRLVGKNMFLMMVKNRIKRVFLSNKCSNYTRLIFSWYQNRISNLVIVS